MMKFDRSINRAVHIIEVDGWKLVKYLAAFCLSFFVDQPH